MKRFILNFVVFVDNTRRKTVIYLPNWGRALTWGRRVLTWGRRVPASAFVSQGSRP